MTNEELYMNLLNMVQKGDNKGKTTPLLPKLKEWLRMKLESGAIQKITADKYDSLYRNHIVPFFDSPTPRMVANVLREDMQNFVVFLKGRIAPKSVLEVINAILSPFFKDMREDGYIEKSPCYRLHLPKVDKTKGSPAISPAEIRNMLAVIPQSDPWYISILLLAYTGMRRGELLALSWDDVDMKKKTIYIHQTNVNTYKEKTQVKDHTKTQAGTRTIAIPSLLVDALQYHKNVVQKQGTPWVIAQKRKGMGLVNPNNYSRWLRTQMKKAGITRKLGAHSFRHFNITASINAGASQVDVMAIVGHTDTRMTALYIDEAMRMQARQDVQDKCANYINNSIGM